MFYVGEERNQSAPEIADNLKVRTNYMELLQSVFFGFVALFEYSSKEVLLVSSVTVIYNMELKITI